MIYPVKLSFQNPNGFEINFDLLREFERDLNILTPEKSRISCRVLGYGEISTVFEIQAETLCGLACKRMSIFETLAELSQYLDAYREYTRLLEEEVGLTTPPHGYAAFVNEAGRPIFYIIQQQVPSASLGNKAVHFLPREGTLALFRRILREVHRVWAFNHGQANCQVALDAQISNWAIADFDSAHPYLDESTPLLYLDTSTPLFRLNGVGQLNAELFLRAAPSYLVWILRLFFLEEVLNRYYDFRQVILDVMANFYKEQRSDLIPDLIPVANAFLAEETAEMGAKPFTAQEVHAYYRQDALIWSLYLGMRRFDRFLHRYLLRRDYPYILPGKTRR
jgi:hypothetical protein